METHVFRRDKNGRRYYWPSLFHLDPISSQSVPLFINDVLSAPSAREFYLGSIPLAYSTAVLIGNHAITSIQIGGRIVGEEMIVSADETTTTVILAIDDTSGDPSIMRCRLPYGVYLAQGLLWGHNYGVVVSVKGTLILRNRQLQSESLRVLSRRGDFAAEVEFWRTTWEFRKSSLSVDWEVPEFTDPQTTTFKIPGNHHLSLDDTHLLQLSPVFVISDSDDDAPFTRTEDSLYLTKRRSRLEDPELQVLDVESDGSVTEIDCDSANSDVEIIAINRQGPPHHVLLAEIIRIIVVNKFAPILIPHLFTSHLHNKWGTFGGVSAACQELYTLYNLIIVSSKSETITSTNLRNLYNNMANYLRRIKLAKMTFDENRTLDIPHYIAGFPHFDPENWDYRIMNALVDMIVMYDVGDKDRWICCKYQWRFKG